MDTFQEIAHRFYKKFENAFIGLWAGIRYDRSILLQFLIAGISTLFFLYLDISLVEWLFVITAIFVVIITEFLNSAIEDVCDLLIDKYDLHVKEIKDIAAAAVLLSAMYAVVVAGIIFWRHLG